MGDLIERLNAVEGNQPDSIGICTNWYRNPDGPEAAAEITRLTAEVERLREALTPFAEARTIEEIMAGDEPLEWANASPERRIELMGERKRQNTENILRARAELASGKANP